MRFIAFGKGLSKTTYLLEILLGLSIFASKLCTSIFIYVEASWLAVLTRDMLFYVVAPLYLAGWWRHNMNI